MLDNVWYYFHEAANFGDSVRSLFVQVKLTLERLKAGWEDTLREREEFSERKIKNLEEQKDKGFYLI